MRNFVLTAINLSAVLLVLVGVIVLANILPARNFAVGGFRLPADADLGVLLIAFGLILICLSAIVGKVLGKK